MIKWARVSNNIVVEIVTTNPNTIYSPTLASQFVECGYEVEQGWQYIDGVFSQRVIKYIIRNGVYIYDYYQDGDTIVTERPTPLNTYTSYMWNTETSNWIIDLATSLDNLNSSYSTAKAEIHKQHSGIILANWLTSEEVTAEEENLGIAYKSLHDDLKTKQEALKNG